MDKLDLQIQLAVLVYLFVQLQIIYLEILLIMFVKVFAQLAKFEITAPKGV
jgi:hypothetical protein